MTKHAKQGHRAREVIDQDSFIKAVQTVLDYLWDDEQQHHAEYGGTGGTHVFNSLQLIREAIYRMRHEAPTASESDESRQASIPDSASPKRHDISRRRRITLLEGDCGTYVIEADDGRDLLIQTDWDYAKVASTFGWSPCACGATDGTVDCLHRTACEMIAEAGEYLSHHIGDTADDPGYFDD